MSKYATFAWSWTVEVPDEFDEMDSVLYGVAIDDAWNNVQKADGVLTDLEDDDDE
jgi:hypothetical protein